MKVILPSLILLFSGDLKEIPFLCQVNVSFHDTKLYIASHWYYPGIAEIVFTTLIRDIDIITFTLRFKHCLCHFHPLQPFQFRCVLYHWSAHFHGKIDISSIFTMPGDLMPCQWLHLRCRFHPFTLRRHTLDYWILSWIFLLNILLFNIQARVNWDLSFNII